MRGLSSRERLLAALSCEKPDYVPCCFMIFQALQRRCASDYEFFDKQLELGLDVRVELPDIPMRFDPEVSVRTWVEEPQGEGVPLLHKEYRTPSGAIRTVVRQTEDWPYGEEIPLFDDYLTPRTQEFLVSGPADLAALRHLLLPPSEEDVAAYREIAAEYKRYAEHEGLLLSGGWRDWRSNPVSVVGAQGGAMLGIDALAWLCGITAPLYWAYDRPGFLEELIDLIAQWDQQQVEIMLDAGAQLMIERAWYSGTEFWSPSLYRRFVVPMLQEKISLVHQAGAKFGYVLTSGMMEILVDLLDLGTDVIIGIDPVQGKGTDLDTLVSRSSGRICLWGGVSAPAAIEGAKKREEIWPAVESAISTCGPQGGFILAPVDNIIDTSQETWKNVLEFIRAWQHLRHV